VDLKAMMTEQMTRFPGVAVTVVEAVGEVVAWSRRWRWSGTARFPGATVKVRRMA
jgi:hypothetical protein